MFTIIKHVYITTAAVPDTNLLINLSLENRLTKLWLYLYIRTVKICSSKSSYIGFGLLLLLISFLFVSGVLSSFLSKI